MARYLKEAEDHGQHVLTCLCLVNPGLYRKSFLVYNGLSFRLGLSCHVLAKVLPFGDRVLFSVTCRSLAMVTANGCPATFERDNMFGVDILAINIFRPFCVPRIVPPSAIS